jgi:hypothetical protein
MRATVVGVAVFTMLLLGGCSLSSTPYNGRQSCQGAGGTYTSDGRCLGGNA